MLCNADILWLEGKVKQCCAYKNDVTGAKSFKTFSAVS